MKKTDRNACPTVCDILRVMPRKNEKEKQSRSEETSRGKVCASGQSQRELLQG